MKVHLFQIRWNTYHQNGDEHANGETQEVADRHHDRRDESEVFEHEVVLALTIVDSAFDEVTDPKPASDTLMKYGKSDTRVFGVVVEVDDVDAGIELPPLVLVEAVGGAGEEGTKIVSPPPAPTPGLTRVFIYSKRKLEVAICFTYTHY